MRYWFLALLVLFCLSCTQMPNVRMVEIATPKGKFHVWTKRIGSNPRIRVLLLHGGPGATHACGRRIVSWKR